jgi:hypothetical protein
MSGWTSPPSTTVPPVDPATYASYLGSPVGISAYAHEQTDAANGFLLQLGTLAGSLAPPTIEPEFPAGPSGSAAADDDRADPDADRVDVADAPSAFTETLTIDDLHAGAVRRGSAGADLRHRSDLLRDRSRRSRCRVVYEDPGLTSTCRRRRACSASTSRHSAASTCRRSIPTRSRADRRGSVDPRICAGRAVHRALLTNLESYLDDVIVNGGTGLNPDVENAIWDRGREREARSRSDALRGLDKMEEMGFALPPGVYTRCTHQDRHRERLRQPRPQRARS